MIGLGSWEHILHQLHSAGTGCSSGTRCSVQAEDVSAAKTTLLKTRELSIFFFSAFVELSPLYLFSLG